MMCAIFFSFFFFFLKRINRSDGNLQSRENMACYNQFCQCSFTTLTLRTKTGMMERMGKMQGPERASRS